MVCRYPPRSGRASLEGWEGHATCLPGGVGGARNLINNMVCRCPPRSAGASLEGGRGTKPDRYGMEYNGT
eukprot:9472472-Pyramimonas_sp.AAC.1